MELSLLRKYINLCRRMPAARSLYGLLSPLWNGFGPTPTYREACRMLEDFHPDRGGPISCSAKPLPEAEYDLLVVVAAHNVEKYVTECLDSVISQQTRFRFLVRVVNDASTDSTGEILRRYAGHQNVEIITHSENRGLSGARNSTIANLNATYVCNLDADDRLAPGAIDCWLKKAYSSGADIVATGLTRFDSASGKTLYTLPQDDRDRVDPAEVPGQPTFFLYRRELFQGIIYPEGYWYEDVIFETLFFPKAKKIASAPGVGYEYRMRPGSITQSHRSKRNLESVYGGAKAIMQSIEAGGWSSPSIISFLLQLCGHIIRISYARLIYLPAQIRKSAMVYWQPAVKAILPYLYESQSADQELFEAILSSDFRRYELNCIRHHRW